MAIPRIRRKGGSEGHDTSHRMNKERHTQKRPDEFGSIQGLRGRCTAGANGHSKRGGRVRRRGPPGCRGRNIYCGGKSKQSKQTKKRGSQSKRVKSSFENKSILHIKARTCYQNPLKTISTSTSLCHQRNLTAYDSSSPYWLSVPFI